MTSWNDATSGMPCRIRQRAESTRAYFPAAGRISRSGVKLSVLSCNSTSMPLKTDSTTINAAVPTVTPATLMAEMILMAFCFFLAKR